jgi:hypothetical protein
MLEPIGPPFPQQSFAAALSSFYNPVGIIRQFGV